MAPDDVDTLVDVNLRAVLHLTRLVVPGMARRNCGHVVNVSSIAGSVGQERLAAYAASKGGVEALTKTLALEWAARGIRVNAVAPGYIETDMTRDLLASRWRSRLLERIPLRRFGRPEEVVGAIVFLASEAASYITGATLFVDGGWTAA